MKSLENRLEKSNAMALDVHERKQVRIRIRKFKSPLEELYGLARREKLGIKRADIAAARHELELNWGR